MQQNVLKMGDGASWAALSNLVDRRVRFGTVRTCTVLARVFVVPKGETYPYRAPEPEFLVRREQELREAGEPVFAGFAMPTVPAVAHEGEVVIWPWISCAWAFKSVRVFEQQMAMFPRMTGHLRRLKRQGVTYWQAYSSPALRAIQIDDEMLRFIRDISLTDLIPYVDGRGPDNDGDRYPANHYSKVGDWLCFLPDDQTYGFEGNALPASRLNVYVIERMTFRERARFLDDLH